MSSAVDRIVPMDRATRLYGHKITKAWQSSVEAILEVGRLLIEAKAELAHGEFEQMVRQSCPFGKRTAERLMKIANHPVLGKATHGSDLPASWRTLDELARFEPTELSHALGNHWVKPEMTRDDVKLLRARTQKALGTRTRMPPKSSPKPKGFQTYLRSSIEPDDLEWVSSLDAQVAQTIAERVASLIQQLRREMTDGESP